MALTLNSPMKRLSIKGLIGGTHGSARDLFIILTLEDEVYVFEAELQQ